MILYWTGWLFALLLGMLAGIIMAHAVLGVGAGWIEVQGDSGGGHPLPNPSNGASHPSSAPGVNGPGALGPAAPLEVANRAPSLSDSSSGNLGQKSKAPAALVVGSCNLAHGRGRKVSNFLIRSSEEVFHHLDGAAERIVEAGADIILVQEIDRDASWSKRVNELARLAERTGLRHAAYQPNYRAHLPWFHLCAGNAILSRYPILEIVPIEYNTASRLACRFPGSKRGMAAKIELPSGEHLLVQCHHFHPYRKGHRSAQSMLVAQEVKRFWSEDSRPSAVILGGDFNMRAKEIRRSALADLHWQALPPGASGFEPTFPAARPMWALDHVFVQSEEWAIAERRVVPTVHSDHAFVFARLKRAIAAQAQAIELEDISEATLNREPAFQGEEDFEQRVAASGAEEISSEAAQEAAEEISQEAADKAAENGLDESSDRLPPAGAAPSDKDAARGSGAP
jgi:endonuclease/exonuclease/phosphatase family metal-dependent hydrolase